VIESAPRSRNTANTNTNHGVDRRADGGPKDAEQALAELGRHPTDLRDQVAAEIGKICREPMGNGPCLPLIDALFSGCE
jgi:hypothetical protein